MFADLVAISRRITSVMLSSTAPAQLAVGFTLGAIIGFVPKTNLIALSLCVLLFSLRCNKGIGVATAIVVTLTNGWFDPFAHKLGMIVLSYHPLQGVYAEALTMPLGPWLGFNNTVVTGSLLIGAYFAFPIYFFARAFFAGIHSVFARQPGARLGLDAELQPRAAL